jgi:uncharacterized protein
MHSYYPRLLTPPRGSFFLFGPRGTGKSQWARKSLPTAHHLDLLDERLFHEYLAEPGRLSDELRTLRRGSWVVLDEVQRIPGLLNEVHRAIEELGLRFALLGSSARKLKTVGTNLLAGRALWRTMLPFVPEELGADFDLETALRFGTIPLVWTATDRRAVLDAYTQLYLREEIRSEGLVRNLPAFVRFLPLAALFHAQTINVSALARDAGTARTTVTGYLDILEDTLLVSRLPAFESKLRVRERKHPKLFWVDPGLVRAAKRQLGPVVAEERGPLLEGWVHTLLRAYADHHGLYEEMWYWAPAEATRTEVDFLLRRGREFLALEVKASHRVPADGFHGLRAIAALPGLVRRILVCGVSRKSRTADGIEVWPINELLLALAQRRLWG